MALKNTLARIVRSLWSVCSLAVLATILVSAAASAADDTPQVEGKAPRNHAILKRTRGGAYFIAKPLKEKYDKLLARANLLKAEISDGRIKGSDAARQLRDLQSELDKLRKEIERRKVLVSPVTVFTQVETATFDLGRARLLVITADQIRVKGWDGHRVKCVLEKIIIRPNNKPVDDQFQEIRVVHQHGLAPNLVGRTAAEFQADEQKFLASPAGQALTEKQRIARAKSVSDNAAGRAIYRDFQGKEIDTLEITGVRQGNRQIHVTVTSEGGNGSSSSQWQRHASLTVYVPRCNAVALRGCLVGLDVDGLHASLLVTSSGSRHRDYNGKFQIKNHDGSLTIDNAPIQLIEQIRGDVTIMSTTEIANTGTRGKGNFRIFYTPPASECVCKNINGNLTAWFSRANLNITAVSGKIDVKNEFGDTRLAVTKPLAQHAHRIVSESGRVEVDLGEDVGTLPVLALTSCGTVRTNLPRTQFESTNFTTGNSFDGRRRNWRGVKPKRERRDSIADFYYFKRPGLVLEGADRSPGLDLISRAGTVLIVTGR